MLTMRSFYFWFLASVEPTHSKETAGLADAWSAPLYSSLTVGCTYGRKPGAREPQPPKRCCAPGLRGRVGALTEICTRVTGRKKREPGTSARFSESYFLFGARWDM